MCPEPGPGLTRSPGSGVSPTRQLASGRIGKARGGSRASARIPRRPPGVRKPAFQAGAAAGYAKGAGRGPKPWAAPGPAGRPLALNASRRGAAGDHRAQPTRVGASPTLPAGPTLSALRCTCPRRDPGPSGPPIAPGWHSSLQPSDLLGGRELRFSGHGSPPQPLILSVVFKNSSNWLCSRPPPGPVPNSKMAVRLGLYSCHAKFPFPCKQVKP